MERVEYPDVPLLHRNPAFSQVAVVPASASWVLVGGQNAVSEKGEIVGKDDLASQSLQVRLNVERALGTAGCSWKDVVRVQVYLKAGQDPRAAFSQFAPALAQRDAPPLVSVYQVAALAHPDFLLEVSCEAVRP